MPQRVDYKLCATVYRCLQRKAPPRLVDLCTPVSDIARRQHLRSASSNQLVVPRHRRTQFGRRAFSVAGPMAWNAGYEIANVNFLYNDTVHALQNKIDSGINSAMHRSTRLEHRFTKFSEITQCNGHYAVHGHSRSSIFVPIENSHTTSYY